MKNRTLPSRCASFNFISLPLTRDYHILNFILIFSLLFLIFEIWSIFCFQTILLNSVTCFKLHIHGLILLFWKNDPCFKIVSFLNLYWYPYLCFIYFYCFLVWHCATPSQFTYPFYYCCAFELFSSLSLFLFLFYATDILKISLKKYTKWDY